MFIVVARPHHRVVHNETTSNKNLEAVQYTMNLNNLDEFSYEGTIFIGSDKQQLKCIYDTGSAWTIVMDSSCSNCGAGVTKFQSSQSTTYSLETSSLNNLYVSLITEML